MTCAARPPACEKLPRGIVFGARFHAARAPDRASYEQLQSRCHEHSFVQNELGLKEELKLQREGIWYIKGYPKRTRIQTQACILEFELLCPLCRLARSV